MGKRIVRGVVLGAAVLGVAGMAMAAVGGGLEGDWTSPSGSVIRVYGCGQEVCAKVIAVEASAPGSTDENNPDKALRSRSLCELQIGQGFKHDDSTHASGGTIYDPKSGKTYKGTMVADGDTLRLRGFIGISVFGRTEIWKRSAAGAVKVCTAG